MRATVRPYFDAELRAARRDLEKRDFAESWRHLERAHILSQAYAWPHILIHLWMSRVAWARRDIREILGQIPRIFLAGPGSMLGRAPLGNTGGADVGIFRPMPIPTDLKEILESKKG